MLSNTAYDCIEALSAQVRRERFKCEKLKDFISNIASSNPISLDINSLQTSAKCFRISIKMKEESNAD